LIGNKDPIDVLLSSSNISMEIQCCTDKKKKQWAKI